MTQSTYPAEIVSAPIEAPQLVYPKGPIRRIEEFQAVPDQIVGEIIIVKLQGCGHQATLVGNLMKSALVRCAICFHEKRTSGETVIESGEDRGPRT